MPRIKNLSGIDRIAIKIARKMSKHGKRESRPVLRSLKSQLRKKKKKSLPGQIPHSRSGKFRKLIQSRPKFQGSLRPSGDSIPFLKVGSFTPIANVMLSQASGKKFRKLRKPTTSELLGVGQRAWKKTLNEKMIQTMLIKETKKMLFGDSWKMGKDGMIRVEYKE